MIARAWSNEQAQQLKNLYLNEEKSIEELAETFDRNTRSVISKLVQLKIYKKPEVVKEEKRTVKRMIAELEEMLDVKLDGLNLNKKSNLEIVVDAVREKLEPEV